MSELFFLAGRYVVLSASGDLYVRSIRSEDALVKYSCLVSNTLNGDRQRSEAVTLQVKGKKKDCKYFNLYLSLIIIVCIYVCY